MRDGIRIGAVSIVIALTPIHAAAEEPSITVSFHFSEPTYDGCDDSVFDDAARSCDDLNPIAQDVGYLAPLFLMLYVGGVPEEGIGAVWLGIDHDSEVFTNSWTLCTGGSEIPDLCKGWIEPCWPEAGGYQGFTWGGGCHVVTDNDDGVTKVGLITLHPESEGRIWLTPASQDGRAAAYLCDGTDVTICEELLGVAVATVGGSGAVNPCGESCRVPVQAATWARVKGHFR